MDVHRVSWVSPFWKRFQVVCGEPNGACHSRVNVIALLKVNVFKEVATDFANRNRIAIHIDSRGIVPSTGISLLRRYSSMLGSSCVVAIPVTPLPSTLEDYQDPEHMPDC
jgi:hypothetical protein